MTLKKKLTMGLGFLFIIIFTMVIFSSYYIQKLSRESQDILRKNYDSIVYCKKMLLALDDMKTSVTFRLFSPGKGGRTTGYQSHFFESGKTEFDTNLKEETKNITEIHEKEYVETLRGNYASLLKLSDQIARGHGSSALYFNEFLPVYGKMRQIIADISNLNMQAIVRKNQLAKQDSSNIIISIAVIGSICVILAFCYIWYFPFYISNSISVLSDRMSGLLKKIGIGYVVRTDDEFLAILQSLTLIEEKYSLKKKEKKKK